MLDNGNGLLFSPAEPWRKERKRKTHNLNLDYNRLYEDQTEAREAILREILGELQEGVFLQGPITFHYGIHTKIGRGTFINFNFTCQFNRHDRGALQFRPECDNCNAAASDARDRAPRHSCAGWQRSAPLLGEAGVGRQ